MPGCVAFALTPSFAFVVHVDGIAWTWMRKERLERGGRNSFSDGFELSALSSFPPLKDLLFLDRMPACLLCEV